MPELPEVETVVRGLRNSIINQTIEAVDISDKQLRLPYHLEMVPILRGKKITDITRYAKYIIIHTNSIYKLVMHLGMSGRLTISGLANKEKHDHVVFKLSNTQLIFNDARRFGLVALVENLDNSKLFSHLGIDPFASEFTWECLYNLTKRSKSLIKSLLMNAKCIVGIGNIYATESLFSAKILPNRVASSLSEVEVVLLYQSIIEVLSKAIDSGGSTLKDYVHADGNIGQFQNSFRAYGRINKLCYECNHIIQRIQIAGRSSFYCANCQK